MTPPNFTEGFCPNVQAKLLEVAGCNTPSIKRAAVGYVSALASPWNKGVSQRQLTFGDNGKSRNVQLIYTQRSTEATVISGVNAQPQCNDTGNIKTPFEQILQVTRWTGDKLQFNENDMRMLCQSDASYMDEVIGGLMNALAITIDKEALALQLAAIGTYADGSVTKNFTVINPGPPRTPDYSGVADLLGEYEDIENCGMPAIIGCKNMRLFNKMVSIGCCNDGGIDLSRAGDEYALFYDKFIDIIAGANNNFVLSPGSSVLLEWYKYVGPYADGNRRGTVTDPFTGLTFDIRTYYDDACETYYVEVGKWWDMFFIPVNAFDAADYLFGTRGTLRAVTL